MRSVLERYCYSDHIAVYLDFLNHLINIILPLPLLLLRLLLLFAGCTSWTSHLAILEVNADKDVQ